MSYLISGFPRTRSAWLAALLGDCVHDAVVQGYPLDGSINVVDPTVACTMPKLPGFDVRICVMRDQSESKAALEAWAKVEVPQRVWDMYIRNVEIYAGTCEYVCWSYQLEEDETVGEIYRLCTNKELSLDRIKLFQTLYIEEHREKMAHRLGLQI